MLRYSNLERFAKDKHSSLLDPFVSSSGASGALFRKLHNFYDLRIGPISWSAMLFLAGKACQRQTL